MLKKIKNKKGEGYIDTCVIVLVFVMAIVITLNIMSFITQRQDLEVICDNLLEVATATGEFGDEFDDMDYYQLDRYPYYDLDFDADEFRSGFRVQLGKKMTVKVWKDTYLKGLGVFKIPVTITVEKSGLSEKYWKVAE